MPLLEVAGLTKHFIRKPGLFGRTSVVKAVQDVTFSIDESEMFGLVGESGSGKSTTGRCILRLIEPTSGDVRFKGENVLGFSRERMRHALAETGTSAGDDGNEAVETTRVHGEGNGKGLKQGRGKEKAAA